MLLLLDILSTVLEIIKREKRSLIIISLLDYKNKSSEFRFVLCRFDIKKKISKK